MMNEVNEDASDKLSILIANNHLVARRVKHERHCNMVVLCNGSANCLINCDLSSIDDWLYNDVRLGAFATSNVAGDDCYQIS